ncbi:class I SAM-dependent methyltransferase [Variovorax rhizosphaerae]|uniref:Class I SAM-dependent methyltransferase n=1 Tax=Variovorax rhizosphaerae TaxID=1836200 RepID=A0ABU8WIA7_9BURK
MKQYELLRIVDLPVLQNRVYASAESARNSPRGDMALVQDAGSGLIFNAAFDPDLLSYDEDYQNEQACSPVFQQHLENVLAIIRRHFDTPSLLEVGCGKGYFLEHLRHAGYRAIGIDPAYEGASPHVIKAPFSSALGLSADAIVLRHVLEHIQGPMHFLRAIARANGGRGKIYIEVPCFDWIRERHAWFDIFYEHVNYFRASDFRRMFGNILEQGHTFNGQYLYVVADLSSLRDPSAIPAASAELPVDFLAGIVRSTALARRTPGCKAIWGGSSKGVIFAHHMQRAGVDFECAIDINPVKQDRFMAGTGLKIVSPETAFRTLSFGALVFVMNSNYFEEIAALSRDRFCLVKGDQHEV